MLILFLFLLSIANSMTLESQCEQIVFFNNKATKKIIDKKKCLQESYLFAMHGFLNDQKIVIGQKEEDVFFCKANLDVLTVINTKNNKKLHQWQTKNDFSTIAKLSNSYELIVYDVENSKKYNKKLCQDFPDFFKMRKIDRKILSPSVKGMNEGGLMLISSNFSGILFIDKDLKQLRFSLNFPEEVTINDAIVRTNQDLIVLTTESKSGKSHSCLEKWDLISGTMMNAKCDLKAYNEQILSNDKNVKRIFKLHSSLIIEEFNEKFESRLIGEIKNSQNFDLNSAYEYE